MADEPTTDDRLADAPASDRSAGRADAASESAELADAHSASATTTTTAGCARRAEFDNYRKRIERERREQADQAVVDLLQELLLVVDDFDRALTVDAGEGGDAYRKGVELIHAQAARPAAQAGRAADRRARRRLRSEPASGGGARGEPGAPRGRSDRRAAHAATCWATGCCGRRW